MGVADRILSHTPVASSGVNVARALLGKLDQYTRAGPPDRVPGRSPRRGVLINTEISGADRFIEFQYNPQQLDFSLSANYAKQSPLGQSHPTSQYVGTNALALNFELYFNATFERREGYEGEPPPPAMYDQLAWLIALFYPQGNATAKSGAALPRPPRVAFQFGDFIFLRGFMHAINPRITQWATSRRLDPTEMTVTCVFEEQLERRLLYSEARAAGTFRAFTSPGGS